MTGCQPPSMSYPPNDRVPVSLNVLPSQYQSASLPQCPTLPMTGCQSPSMSYPPSQYCTLSARGRPLPLNVLPSQQEAGQSPSCYPSCERVAMLPKHLTLPVRGRPGSLNVLPFKSLFYPPSKRAVSPLQCLTLLVRRRPPRLEPQGALC